MTINTKFNKTDIAYILYKNEVVKVRIEDIKILNEEISYTFVYYGDTSCKRIQSDERADYYTLKEKNVYKDSEDFVKTNFK